MEKKRLVYDPNAGEGIEGVCYNCLNGGHYICDHEGCKCAAKSHKPWWWVPEEEDARMSRPPWKFDDTEGCRTIKAGKIGTGKQAQYSKIAFTVGLADDKRDRANAKAIINAINSTYGKGINPSSVPDLLDCLEKIVDIATDRWRPLPPTSHEKNCLSSARAAIKLAKSIKQ